MMNSRNFNTQSYERILSTFGKKVLGNLIKNFDRRSEFNNINVRSRYNYGQNKPVLNFGDSFVPSSTCEQNLRVTASHDIDLINDSRFTDSQHVITSKGLLKSDIVSDKIGIDDKFISLKDNAQPSEAIVIANDQTSNKKLINSTYIAKEHIEWDDIFDTQLLNDLSVLDTDSNIETQKGITEITNKSNPPFVEHENDITNNKDISSKTNSLETTKNANPSRRNMLNQSTIQTNGLFYDCNTESKISGNIKIKKDIRKRASSNKITIEIPKKLKLPSAELQTNAFRKQKYTKAVKTWLSNVEPENIQIDRDAIVNTGVIKRDKKIIPESTNLKAKKHAKKTVQAQLTNKGGVMKFGKPKTNEHEPKMESSTNIANKHSGIAFKEKRMKPKFVAPIKSQTTEKTISFHIIHLKDEDHEAELSAINNEEINMILTFSDGFCQLNSPYTEDGIEADGVMFENNNVIYYWKFTYKTFCGTMEKLINNNTIVCYDGKNLLKYFIAQCGINIISTEVKVLDLQIGGYLLDPSNSPTNFTDLQKALSFVPEYSVAAERVQQKCAMLLVELRECFGRLRTLLVDYKLWNVFVEIEMPVLPIVAEMEQSGVRVDTERLKAMESSLVRRMRVTERACHAAAGRAFQLNSPQQVRAILYDDLKLDIRGNVRVRETLCKGDKSTSETMLRGLMTVHPLPRLILEYRHVHKAHATFVAGIANQVKDGVIKPTWEQTAAVTGRIACNNPNLQAIPKAPFSLVLFPAETNEEELLAEPNETLNFRSVYIPREGLVLLAADFRHIECRVFAYAAADTSLLDALASPDLFRVLAARCLTVIDVLCNTKEEGFELMVDHLQIPFNEDDPDKNHIKMLKKSSEDVSSEDRERTKRIVYASLYGAGARRLADILGLGYDQTLSVVASFNRTFPSLKSFGRDVVARCERDGGRLTTLCGRGRTFPNIFSGDSALRAQAERQAINFIVQGSAADLCKLAMAGVTRRLQGAGGARLLLQIHDELVWEVRPDELDRVAAKIKSAMEGIGEACRVSVPLPVAIRVGHDWGSMEEYCPPQH